MDIPPGKILKINYLPAAGRQIPNNYAYRLMGLFSRKFDATVSSLDFGGRRIMLHENLTELCQVWTLEVEG